MIAARCPSFCYHPGKMVNCVTQYSTLTISDLPSWVTVFLTSVIAVSTVAYVWLTKRLWTETKRSAEAAMAAALAAKKSAEVTADLHRPFMGLPQVTHKTGWGTDSWEIVFVLKNYGTMPALKVGVVMEFFAGTSRFAEIIQPTSMQIFPSAEIESTVWISPQSHRVPIQRGVEKLRINVRIPYQAENGRHFEHHAEASYAEGLPGGLFSHMPGRFVIDKSETLPVDPI
jgi:hypothetical protein